MLVIRVELHSAVTGKVTEIGRMLIDNIGGTDTVGEYRARVLRGRSANAFAQRVVQRTGLVLAYPRKALHVWHLVARALAGMGYGRAAGVKVRAEVE